MRITLLPGTPVELFAATGLTPKSVLSVTNLSSREIQLYEVAGSVEIVPSRGTSRSRDGLMELYAVSATGGTIDVQSPPLLSDLPAGLFTGFRAMTVQSYVEANVKNGTQFYTRVSWPTSDDIAGSGTRKVHFQIGAKPILVKTIRSHFIGTEFERRIYADPTGVTGGTAAQISNANNDPAIAQATTIAVTYNVTTVTDGVEAAEPEYYYGSSSQGGLVSETFPPDLELYLPANTSFLFTITNNDNNAARFSLFIDWYEGDVDIPL